MGRLSTKRPDWYQYFQDLRIDNFPKFLYDYYSFRQPIIGHIINHVPKGGSIIELGTGSGLLAVLLSSLGYSVLGIDYEPRNVEMAKKSNKRLGGQAAIVQMDMFEAGKRLSRIFDLAFSEGVIEHYRGRELHEAVRVHKKLGRKVMFVVPTPHDPLVREQDTYDFTKIHSLCRANGLLPIDDFTVGTSLIKWPKLLIPPILLARMKFLKWEMIGVVCRNPEYT